MSRSQRHLVEVLGYASDGKTQAEGGHSVGSSAAAALAALFATLNTSLKASTAWPNIDSIYAFVETDRLVNLKSPGTFDATLVGGAVYVDGLGIYCDPATSSYIDSNCNPSLGGRQYTLNAATFGILSGSSHPVITGTPGGAFDGTNGTTLNMRTSINGNSSCRMNQGAALPSTGGPVTDHFGWGFDKRTASNAVQQRKDKVQIVAGTNVSTAIANATIKFGTANGTTFATPGMLFRGGVIGNLSNTQCDEIVDIFATFFTAYDALKKVFRPQINAWWAEPIAETNNGIISVGGSMKGNGQDGAFALMEIDENSAQVIATKRVADLYPGDDHVISVFKRLASGKGFWFGNGHGLKDDGVTADHTLSFAVSPTGRIADLGPISTITNTMVKTNYGQVHQMGNGRIFAHLTVDGDKLIGTAHCDNDGVSFQPPNKPHVTQAAAPGGGQNQLYEQCVKTGASALRLFSIPHPTNTQNNVRLARIDTADGNYYSGVGGATGFGTIYAAFGAALTDVTNLSAITALAAGRSQRLLDVASDGTMFLVVEYDNPGGANATYYLYRLIGADPFVLANWGKSPPIVLAGVPFWASSFYYGGAVFARHAHSGIMICTAREAAGTKFIEQRVSMDNGANWAVTELKRSTTLLCRPVSTGSTRLPWIWQRITAYVQFDNFSGASLEWQ